MSNEQAGAALTVGIGEPLKAYSLGEGDAMMKTVYFGARARRERLMGRLLELAQRKGLSLSHCAIEAILEFLEREESVNGSGTGKRS